MPDDEVLGEAKKRFAKVVGVAPEHIQLHEYLDANALSVRLRQQQQARIESELRRAAERAAKAAEQAAAEAAEKKKAGKRTVSAPKKKKKRDENAEQKKSKNDQLDNVVPPLDEARTISQLNLDDGAIIFYIYHVDFEAEVDELEWEPVDVPVLCPYVPEAAAVAAAAKAAEVAATMTSSSSVPKSTGAPPSAAQQNSI